MLATVPAFLQPSTFFHALRANLTAEPKVLFVYVLLLVIPWVLWQGHRTGEADPYGEDGNDDDSRPARRSGSRRGKKDREPRSKKNRPGQINWIQ